VSVGALWHTRVVDENERDSVSVDPTEVLAPGVEAPSEGVDESEDFISQPAKVMRIGSMVKVLLDEARSAPLDEAGRARMREIYEQSVSELSLALSKDLSAELARMATPFTSDVPSESELRVAQAQLVGWLEGLFHGIQATIFAQQAAAQAQLQEMRNRQLSAGGPEGGSRAGTYL
jgi:hypothetical protein